MAFFARLAIAAAKATIFIYQQPPAPASPQSRRGFRLTSPRFRSFDPPEQGAPGRRSGTVGLGPAVFGVTVLGVRTGRSVMVYRRP